MTTSLADHLRSRTDDELSDLLRRRPDLTVPVPVDVSALAARAQSRVSTARALEGLTQFTLLILDAARLTRDADGHTSVTAILAMAPSVAEARDALAELRALFLLYGPDNALELSPSLDDVSSPYPAGLGHPAADLNPRTEALCADPARLRRAVLAASPAARAVLDRLAEGPPVGTVSAAALAGVTPGSAIGAADADAGDDGADEPGGPVRRLVEQGLLVPVSAETVELPREIGLLLRRDTGPLGVLRARPPAITPVGRDPKAADSAGAGQAMETVRRVEALLEAVAAEPPAVLRAGGLGVREIRRLAKTAGVEEGTSILLLEVAYAAGLLGDSEAATAKSRRVGGPAGEQIWLPTVTYDLWRAMSLAQRWASLAGSWLAMPRQVVQPGQRDDRDKPLNALSADGERPGAPTNRRVVMEVLAGLSPGAAPTGDEILSVMVWRSPRRTRGWEGAAHLALAEAAALGVTGLGALTSFGRLLVEEESAATARDAAMADDPLGRRAEADRAPGDPEAVRALDGLLPAPVDHVLIQADLSVVVPGPPEPSMAAELEAVADQESAGGASVYRLTTASVRRALDAGYSADELHTLFKVRSRTPVPQALTYLVDDVARKHGGLRVGTAGAYLRSDDESLLAEALADKRLAQLALRRLAPTVLCSPYAPGRLLPALREAGYAPVPEDASGATVLARPKSKRAAARIPLGSAQASDSLIASRLTRPRLSGIVEQIRRGDAAARAARRAPSTVRESDGQAHTLALAVLQQAVRDKALVWVGYVDAHGATATRLVRPVSIGAGYLRAEDERTEMLHTMALHRITAAVLPT
ncbi:helicase-associated domain-containing protein [Catenuloplanes japonicus]|uniref:helicase-associated domain-containing protein n=1 Tax=Catenuloplanes japonicus TaxID=33876 RepID=UPI0005252B64|nr:helicase-associated domain-containing protein [Catenuloplanes japonicus]